MTDSEDLPLPNAERSALLVDFETFDCEEIIASDFNRLGCMVQSKNVKQVGQLIGLRVAGLDKMIKGRVFEIRDEDVVIRFEFGDDLQTEKRKERRRPMSISAEVSGVFETGVTPCKIVDASQSGCRLSGDKVDELPDDILVRIARLDRPVRGQIMWRGSDVAGVKLLWEFSGKNDVYSQVLGRRKGKSSRHTV